MGCLGPWAEPRVGCLGPWAEPRVGCDEAEAPAGARLAVEHRLVGELDPPGVEEPAGDLPRAAAAARAVADELAGEGVAAAAQLEEAGYLLVVAPGGAAEGATGAVGQEVVEGAGRRGGGRARRRLRALAGATGEGQERQRYGDGGVRSGRQASPPRVSRSQE